MTFKFTCLASFAFFLISINISCNKEPLANPDVTAVSKLTSNALALDKQTFKTASLKLREKALSITKIDEFNNLLENKIIASHYKSAVIPSECEATEFYKVIDKYISEFGPLEFDLFGIYAAINQLSTFLDNSKQYFGADGKNTKLVMKHQRRLEELWEMPNEVRINGEHNSTLDDRDKVAEVYMVFAGLSADEAYAIADEIITINKESLVFIETPLLSFDAFASSTNLIVLGDGIIQTLTETRIENDVVVAGVLAHEWGHQVQFNYSQSWFGVTPENWPFNSEFTRLTELEADYFAGYYLTHKKGATNKWKKSAKFFNLFYNIGDCSFTDPSHHGTPNQRMAASRLGFIIANISLYTGYELNTDELHSLYLVAFNNIINNKISIKQAYKSLNTDKLKAIYKKILQHRKELKLIMGGNLDKTNIENL